MNSRPATSSDQHESTTQQTITAQLCLEIIRQPANRITNEIYRLIQNPEFDINAKTIAGYSPIYYAVKMGHLELVRELEARGASLIDQYDNLTLRDIALKMQDLRAGDPSIPDSNYRDIIQLLEDKNIPFDAESLTPTNKNIIQNTQGGQYWIRKSIGITGYRKLGIGYCHGVAMMGLQALLIGKRESGGFALTHLENFKRRVAMLQGYYMTPNRSLRIDMDKARHKQILLTELSKLEYKKRDKSNTPPSQSEQSFINKILAIELTPDDKSILEIQPFLDGINLYQTSHEELFENRHGLGVLNVLPIVTISELDKKGGMVIADQFTGVYNRDDLTHLLASIRHKVKNSNYSSPLGIHLSSQRHAISIGYDPFQDKWIFIDANNTSSVGKEFVSDQELGDEIRSAFFLDRNDNQSSLIISANVYSTAAQYKNVTDNVFTPLRESNRWKRIHAITEEKLTIRDSSNLSLEDRATHNGDIETITNINAFEKENKSFISRHPVAAIAGSLSVIPAAGVLAAAIILSVGPIAIIASIAMLLLSLTVGPFLVALKNHKDMEEVRTIHQEKANYAQAAFDNYENKVKTESTKSISRFFANDTNYPAKSSKKHSQKKRSTKKRFANDKLSYSHTLHKPHKRENENTNRNKHTIKPSKSNR